jgi:hypothetical protein
MPVKRQVFGSNPERRNYEKLREQWDNNYEIYPNLPFMMVIDPKEKVPSLIDKRDLQRLKKTSIDYTLCDLNGKPILCIEFDGMNEGFNVGTQYHMPKSDVCIPKDNIWRKTITELKLRVAHSYGFPFFVLGSEHLKDLTPQIHLSIVDGIIGEVLSTKAARKKGPGGD